MNPAKMTQAIQSRLSEYLGDYILVGIGVDGRPVTVVSVSDHKAAMALNHMMSVTTISFDEPTTGDAQE